MSETKWTPGPWRFTGEKRVASPDGINILAIGISFPSGNHPDRLEAEANSRLIAAAPDLYEALEDVVKAYRAYRLREGDDETSDSIDLAEAALAKARGETP